MTALDRALGWFIAPPDEQRPHEPAAAPPPRRPRRKTRNRTAPHPDPSTAENRPSPSPVPPAGLDTRQPPAWQPAAATSPRASVAGEPSSAAAVSPRAVPDATVASEPLSPAADATGAAVVTSAAVLGRTGEAEPVAAALALALRRDSRAKVGTVVVVGAEPREATEPGNGGGAARRAVARLEAHGFDARVRGRLAWVALDPGEAHVVSAVRRLALIAAPAVFAVTAPRTAALDEALAEQDLLVVVTSEPDGPLARLAAAGLPEMPVVVARPLSRGPARMLARAGLHAPRAARDLVPQREEAHR